MLRVMGGVFRLKVLWEGKSWAAGPGPPVTADGRAKATRPAAAASRL